MRADDALWSAAIKLADGGLAIKCDEHGSVARLEVATLNDDSASGKSSTCSNDTFHQFSSVNIRLDS